MEKTILENQRTCTLRQQHGPSDELLANVNAKRSLGTLTVLPAQFENRRLYSKDFQIGKLFIFKL